MSTPSIIIVEDEQAIRDMLAYILQANGFAISSFSEAQSAFKYLQINKPDLILLDWMLPNLSGLQFIKKLKAKNHTAHIPIIILTAKADEEQKILGLETGADDYITKPFSPKELVTRIKTVLRRGALKTPENIINIGDLHIDLNQYQVKIKNELLDLSPNSFRLLQFFVTHQRHAFSRAEILNQVWGVNNFNDERSVDVEVRRLRKALGSCGYYIKTIRSVGYLFDVI